MEYVKFAHFFGIFRDVFCVFVCEMHLTWPWKVVTRTRLYKTWRFIEQPTYRLFKTIFIIFAFFSEIPIREEILISALHTAASIVRFHVSSGRQFVVSKTWKLLFHKLQEHVIVTCEIDLEILLPFQWISKNSIFNFKTSSGNVLSLQ